MNQRGHGEIERSKTSQDGTPTGARPGQRDDNKGSITSGSPRNLVLVATVVGLLFFAGVVFYIAAILGDSDAAQNNWRTASALLAYVGTGVFYAGVLVGLGTIATARLKAAPRRALAVASLLSKAGAAVVFVGVVEAICMVGGNQHGQGWQYEASQVAVMVATRVFQGGVLAGLALLCLQQSEPGDPES